MAGSLRSVYLTSLTIFIFIVALVLQKHFVLSGIFLEKWSTWNDTWICAAGEKVEYLGGYEA